MSISKILVYAMLVLTFSCGSGELNSDMSSGNSTDLVDEPGVKYLPGTSADPNMACHYHLVQRNGEMKKIEHCVPLSGE